MGFRFRKSISCGPVRINLSKSGIGYSVGVKGARITKKANGGTRTTLSVPGTGISYVSDSKKGRKKIMNSNTNKTKMKEVSYTATSAEGYNVNNIFNKFELSDKEMLLLSFISQNYQQFNNEFSIHDMSALGHISTATYYNNLYDKALLLKPAKGKYALNIKLINKLANEEIERQKIAEEVKRQRIIEEEENKRKAFEAQEAARLKQLEQKEIYMAAGKNILGTSISIFFTLLFIALGISYIKEGFDFGLAIAMFGMGVISSPLGPKKAWVKIISAIGFFIFMAAISC